MVTEPQRARPNLDEHDFATVRQLYSEAQQWTRHYESLVVNANVLLISASLIFVGLAFGNNVSTAEAVMILGISLMMTIVGIALTQTLFGLYASCIERMIRLEHLLDCYDGDKFADIDGKGPLLAKALAVLPVRRPASVRFFFGLYVLLIVSYLALIGAILGK